MESANIPVGSAPPPTPDAPAKPPRSTFQRVAWGIFGVIFLAIGASQLYGVFRDNFTLPACDSQRAKDSLSKVIKEHKFEPVRYESVKEVSRTDDTVVCNAVLPLPDGVNLVADYSFFWEGSTAKIKYSLVRKAP